MTGLVRFEKTFSRIGLKRKIVFTYSQDFYDINGPTKRGNNISKIVRYLPYRILKISTAKV